VGFRNYRDLRVWQKAMQLAEGVYLLAAGLPGSERFGLAEQLRRAGVSVPANIAEGYGRYRSGEYIRFLEIANGSLKELETHMILAQRLNFLSVEQTGQALDLAEDVGRMLTMLRRRLRSPSP
jgi:four helix bundle protein